MTDYVLPPTMASGYRLHQAVYAIASGDRIIYARTPDSVRVRTDGEVVEASAREIAPFAFSAGDTLRFTLVAAVTKRDSHGCREFVASTDLDYRRNWLARRAAGWGFAVVSMDVMAEKEVLDKPNENKRFAVDRTEFTGVVQVTAADLLRDAMARGVGWCKFMGRGLIVVGKLD